jgi:phosphotransferase system HPr (HPr) family protein
MIREVAVITNQDGLHARPVAEFVRLAATEGHAVKVSRPGQEAVRGDSILSILSLGLKAGERVEITVTGPTENDLLRSLLNIVGTPKSD